jgi:hypothetical protein
MFHHAPTPRLPASMHVDRLASMHVSCLVVPASLLPPMMRRGNPVCRFQQVTSPSPRVHMHNPKASRLRHVIYPLHATCGRRLLPLYYRRRYVHAARARKRASALKKQDTPPYPLPNMQLHFVRSHARAHIHFPLLPLPLTSLHCRPAAKQHQSVHQ